MKRETLFQILSGAILVALGVLIAIFQIGALDLYFGIIAIIGGAVLLAYGIYLLAKKNGVNGSSVILACVLLALGITLVIHFVSFGALIPLILTLLIGGGTGLVLVGVYAIAKKALQDATEAAALEWAPDIRVNAVAPGIVLPPPGGQWEKMLPLLDKIPLKQRTTEQEIANAVSFLIESTFITGQTIYADGGLHLLGAGIETALH